MEQEVARGGLTVERQTELVSLSDTGTEVIAELKHADGRVEQIATDYAVGCDGAHSTVRHAANIAYAGGSYMGDFILGDVTIQWPLASNTARLFFTENGILACLPINGDTGYFRLILVAPGGKPPTEMQATIPPDEFCRVLATLSPVEIKVTDYVWLARFRLHHRMAERFRNGRLFLAGDAAHIHSPVGAQGMNTGIQDALEPGQQVGGRDSRRAAQRHARRIRAAAAAGRARGGARHRFGFSLCRLRQPRACSVGCARRLART